MLLQKLEGYDGLTNCIMVGTLINPPNYSRSNIHVRPCPVIYRNIELFLINVSVTVAAS